MSPSVAAFTGEPSGCSQAAVQGGGVRAEPSLAEIGTQVRVREDQGVRVAGPSTREKGAAVGRRIECVFQARTAREHVCTLEICRGFPFSLWLSFDLMVTGPTQSQ